MYDFQDVVYCVCEPAASSRADVMATMAGVHISIRANANNTRMMRVLLFFNYIRRETDKKNENNEVKTNY